MNRETTYKGMVEGWERLSEWLTANASELAHLETSRVKLEGLLTQARQVAAVQAAQVAAKQQASQSMKTIITEGERVANVLRASVKEHYGIRSEKLAEFGVKPFRGRKPKAAPETPGAPAPGTPAPSPSGSEAHPPSGSSHP
jgi:hypothetical protein